MPVTISKKNGKYEVSTPNAVHAKGTTLEKAKSQEQLLNAVEHGWKSTGKPSGGKNSAKLKVDKLTKGDWKDELKTAMHRPVKLGKKK